MPVLRNVAIGLLCFFLFFSLSMFGFVFMINSTVLNPSFLDTEVNRLDMPSLVEEALNEQTQESELSIELKTAILDNIASIEPLIKEQFSATIHPIYDYLLGKKESPELVVTLRSTFFSTEFINSIIDELDIAPLVRAFIDEQIPEDIPEDVQYLVDYSDEYLDEVVTTNKPWLKDQINIVTDPILDYLLGESTRLDVEISLEPVLTSLEDTMREPFLESPPPSLAHLSRSALEQHYQEHFEELADEISIIELDESVFGLEVAADITTTIADVEEVMEESRTYISYFRLGYILLIVFMLLLVAGIILISRNVRHITRSLGITILVYGAIEFIGIFVTRYVLWRFTPLSDIPTSDIPQSLEPWLEQFIIDFLAPLQWFSLGLIIVGVALVVVSFVYRRGET